MDLQYRCVFCLLKFKETKHTWVAKSGSSRNQYYLIASNGMSICYAVTPGGWKGLRRTPFASLTPAPPTIYFVPLTAELVSCGPLPLPVSGGGHASAIPSILPVAFSRLYSLGSILPLPSSDTFLPPPSSCRYLPPHCHRNTLPLTISP